MKSSFGDMAGAIGRHARDESMVLAECEELAARLTRGFDGAARNDRPGSGVYYERPGLDHELAALRRRAAIVGEAHSILAALAPIERPVRAALATIAAFKRLSTRLRRNAGE